MPPGDLLNADFQVEIQGTLTGEGTAYQLGPEVVRGLLDEPEPKTRDFEYQGQDGSAGAGDFRDVRVLHWDYLIGCRDEGVTGDVDQAVTDALALVALWQPVSDPDGIELHFQLPGFGHKYVVGFPRGITFTSDSRLWANDNGFTQAIARFDCLNPAILTP